jgi:hypothetical protein
LLNTTFHSEDFRVPAKWHFFAASHGTLKRYAVRASLQQPYQAMYDCPQSSSYIFSFDFVRESEYKEGNLLSSQFATAEAVYGNEQLHAFMPIKKGVQKCICFS